MLTFPGVLITRIASSARLACAAILVPGLARIEGCPSVATVSMGNYSTVTMEIFRETETCTVGIGNGLWRGGHEGDFTLINGLGGLYIPARSTRCTPTPSWASASARTQPATSSAVDPTSGGDSDRSLHLVLRGQR